VDAAVQRIFRTRPWLQPDEVYPALWYDIGPDTAAVRNALWVSAPASTPRLHQAARRLVPGHDILLSGHQDQEEIANPVGVTAI